MERMIITAQDVENIIGKSARPFEEAAARIGIKKDDLDIRKAVETPVPKPDDYTSRLIKYIPAEIVALYLMLEGVVKSSTVQEPLQACLLWGIFGVMLIMLPFYLWHVMNVPRKRQVCFSTAAFTIWVFATGGPFSASLSSPWYEPVYGTILIGLSTFIMPIFGGGPVTPKVPPSGT